MRCDAVPDAGDVHLAGAGHGRRGGGRRERGETEEKGSGDKAGNKAAKEGEEDETGFVLRASEFVKMIKNGEKQFSGECNFRMSLLLPLGNLLILVQLPLSGLAA